MSQPKAEKFIWDNLDANIVQPPLVQARDGCAFTATVRQLEYQIRIAYAQANPPIQLNPKTDEPLFNHLRWHQDLAYHHPRRNVKNLWTPWELLLQAYDHYYGNGCPCSNRLQHWIDRLFAITNNGESVEVNKIQEQLSQKMPLIAVINIFLEDYRPCGKSVYIGKPPPTEESEIKKLSTHAVVLVGSYEAVEGNEYDISTAGTYFLYQDSLHRGIPEDKSLFGNCISILHPQVILAVFYGFAMVPNLLVPEERIDEVKMINEDKLRKRRIETSDSLEWHKYKVQHGMPT